LETYKTLTGDDVIAVIKNENGPLVDGRPYAIASNVEEIEKYHAAAVLAHKEHQKPAISLPVFKG
jgi:hypothetical protein